MKNGFKTAVLNRLVTRSAHAVEVSQHQLPVAPAQASHYIVNPLVNRRVSFSELFTTHPPAEERIRRLRSREWAWAGF